MRRLAVLFAALLALATPGAALADVSVRYEPVRSVSSLVYRSVSERDALFKEIARLLTRLGERDLPQGQSLTVDLIDIRPAGQFQPWRPTANSVRVLSDVTPPSVKLRYVLRARGKTIARGEETVTDMNYLWDPAGRSSLSSFPYESELMRDWFRNRIVRLKPPLR